MKPKITLLLTTLCVSATCTIGQAQLTVPSDGTDGVLEISGDVVIDLAQAPTARWDANNTANAGKGIYDPERWAVVFKYSSVNIASGARVRFQNNATRAPVVWLVQGHVTINGTLDLSGQIGVEGVAGLVPAEPGPGGARGGVKGPQGDGSGLGPGGGSAPNKVGQYATTYGNPRIVPLIGGSGGAAHTVSAPLCSGDAGGGAILIAAGGSVRIDGAIVSKGGTTKYYGSGSGGAVRIVAIEIAGTGEVFCLAYAGGDRHPETDGRIRLEALSTVSGIRTAPETVIVKPENPPIIWLPDNAPRVRIVSVDAVDAPLDPTAPLRTSADVAIQNDSKVVVVLETRNLPLEGDVSVRFAQKWGSAQWLRAAYTSGDASEATWVVTNTFVKGYTTLQARATAP
jgi:hypothetical protein